MERTRRAMGKVGSWILALGALISLGQLFYLRDNYSPLAIDSALDARLDAYVPLVAANQELLSSRFVSSQQLRSHCDQWIAKIDSGELKTIYPAYHGETIMEGPKGDAIRGALLLSGAVSRLAQKELEQGQERRALQDVERAMKLIHLVRFGNQETMIAAASFLVKPYAVTSELKRRSTRLNSGEMTESGARAIPVRKIKMHQTSGILAQNFVRDTAPAADPRKLMSSDEKLADALLDLVDIDHSPAEVKRMRHLEKTQRTQYIVRYGEESALEDAVFRFKEIKSVQRTDSNPLDFWSNRIRTPSSTDRIGGLDQKKRRKIPRYVHKSYNYKSQE